ncbi:caspase family protein [Chelatococcus sambhunathii]|uniref:Caspase family protein n=1 Tax=Chelatococcus sambhunathii TaxID=363953 RepID=A0ABU1DET9_9HYPH|nr:caspase family protein [Chelatococcus sambhunathii]MDR4306627.1 caspase family protein [Chelatococcus sambhunathii]
MRAFLLSLLILLAGVPDANARRLALVVGNDAYANLGPEQQLRNAVNDARAVAAALTGIGYEVTIGENLTRGAMIDKISDVASRLNQGDTAFFFFAGHGVSFAGANYLLPSDVPMPRATARAEEGRLADQAIGEALVTERLKGSGATVVVLVLDACRNNPLQSSDKRSIGASRGLSIQPPPRGVITMYSAGAGQTALDRLGDDDPVKNSVFTRVLLQKIAQPDMSIQKLARQTRNEVAAMAEKIGHDQVPGIYDEIVGDEVYLGDKPLEVARADAGAVPAAPPAPKGPAEDEIAWAVLKDTGSAAQIGDLIRRYPRSALIPVWSERLAAVQREEQAKASAAATPAPSPTLPGVDLFANVDRRPPGTPPTSEWNRTDAPVGPSTGPSFPCSRARLPAERVVCGRPNLAALDRQLAELYAASARSPALDAAQGMWRAQRDACANASATLDALAACVEQAYRSRIAALAAAAGSQGAASPTARFSPSYDCRYARTPVEIAICSDQTLAALDIELARSVTVMKAAQRFSLPEHQRWLAARDACANDPASMRVCVASAYRRRIGELR